MKRLLKIFILLLIFIPSFVFASEIELVDIEPIYDEESGIVINQDDTNDFNATFNDADQTVKFKANIINNYKKELIIESIKVTSPTYNFMSYKVININKDDVLLSGEKREIIIEVTSKHSTDLLQNFKDNIIVEINGKPKDIIAYIENPKTGIENPIIFIPVIILLFSVYFIVKKRFNNKYYKYYLIALFIISLVTFEGVRAVNDFSLKIKGVIDYKSLNIMMPRYTNTMMKENNNEILVHSGSSIDYNAPYSYRFSSGYSGNIEDRNLLGKKAYYIEEIEFKADGIAPTEYDLTDDFSLNNDGRVKIYLKNIKQITAYGRTYDIYKAYIVADGILYFPEDSSYFFAYTGYIRSIKGFENTSSSYSKYMNSMFEQFAREEDGYNFNLDFSKWDLSNVITMYKMFYNAFYFASEEEDSNVTINFEGTDTSNVLDMAEIFNDMAYSNHNNKMNLTIKMNNINVEKVKTFYRMFECFMRYTQKADLRLKGWTINGCTYGMFFNFANSNHGDAYLEISDFKINNGAEYMFHNGGGSAAQGKFKVVMKNITLKGSASHMFYLLLVKDSMNPQPRELVIDNWDTSEMTNMDYMFSDCEVPTLDLSSFDTSKVTSMNGLAFSNSSIENIYVSNKWTVDHIDEANTRYIISSYSPLYYEKLNQFPTYYKSYLDYSDTGILTYKAN